MSGHMKHEAVCANCGAHIGSTDGKSWIHMWGGSPGCPKASPGCTAQIGGPEESHLTTCSTCARLKAELDEVRNRFFEYRKNVEPALRLESGQAYSAQELGEEITRLKAENERLKKVERRAQQVADAECGVERESE